MVGQEDASKRRFFRPSTASHPYPEALPIFSTVNEVYVCCALDVATGRIVFVGG